LPRPPPSFGCSAIHQIVGATLDASDRTLPSQAATRIAALDDVDARYQSLEVVQRPHACRRASDLLDGGNSKAIKAR
jgi:hypothetical protein